MSFSLQDLQTEAMQSKRRLKRQMITMLGPDIPPMNLEKELTLPLLIQRRVRYALKERLRKSGEQPAFLIWQMTWAFVGRETMMELSVQREQVDTILIGFILNLRII